MKVTNFLLKNKQIIILSSLLLLVGSSILNQRLFNQQKKLSFLNEGLGTCFARVAQSFTAKMIGDFSSPLVTKSFFSTTEDCFADISSELESLKISSSFLNHGNLSSQLNLLNEVVYNFHQKLSVDLREGIYTGSTQVYFSNLSRNFEKVEIKRDQFLESLDQGRVNVTSRLSFYKIIFLFFSVLSPLLIFINIYFSLREQKLFREIEGESAKLLSSSESHATRVEELISQALKVERFENLRKIFEIYRVRLNSTNESVERADTVGQPEFIVPKVNLKKQIDTIWEREEQKVSTHHNEKNASQLTSLKNEVESTLDGYSSQLIKKGIDVEVSVSDGGTSIDCETVSQLIYYTVSSLINDKSATVKDRLELCVTGKTTKSNFILNFELYGQDFSADQLKNIGKGKLRDVNIDLAICLDLSSMANCKLNVEQTRYSGKAGKKISISFPLASHSKKLISLKKFRKKDFQQL